MPALLRADRPRAADVAGLRDDARCSGPCGSCVRSDGSAGDRPRRSRAPRAAAGRARPRRSRPTSAERARTTRRTARARASTSTPSLTSSSVSPWRSCSSPQAPLRATTRRRRAAPPLGQLSREIGLAARDLARHLVLPRGDPVGPRGHGVRPAARRVDLNEPRHRSLPSGASGASFQRRGPARRKRTTPPSTSCPSRKIVAETTTSSPTTRLTGKRPQSTCGSTSWIWIERGCLCAVGHRA